MPTIYTPCCLLHIFKFANSLHEFIFPTKICQFSLATYSEFSPACTCGSKQVAGWNWRNWRGHRLNWLVLLQNREGGCFRYLNVAMALIRQRISNFWSLSQLTFWDITFTEDRPVSLAYEKHTSENPLEWMDKDPSSVVCHHQQTTWLFAEFHVLNCKSCISTLTSHWCQHNYQTLTKRGPPLVSW